MFSQIGQLRSLCPGVPLLALTATSGSSNRRKVMKQLCFQQGCEIIVESPDRPNIKIFSINIPNNDEIQTTFSWLLEDLHLHKDQQPRHIICCEAISTVSKIYSIVRKVFNKHCNNFDMYHSKTPETKKSISDLTWLKMDPYES